MQGLRHQEAAIVVGQRGRPRRRRGEHPGAAGFEIALQALHALVALLGILFQQALDDGRQPPRQAGEYRMRPVRAARDVAMHQFHPVARLERRLPRQQFIEGGPERIEIGAVVDAPVHAAGLFRRHVAQRAFQRMGMDDALAFLRQLAGDAEIDQLQQAPFVIPHQVRRIDVLVDHALAMDLRQRRAQLQRDVEESVQRQRALRRRLARRHPGAQQLVERDAADVFLDHGPAPAVQFQRERMHHARMAAAARDRIFALELGQLLERGKQLVRQLDDQCAAVGGTGAVNQRARAVVQLFDDLVVEKSAHGLGLRCAEDNRRSEKRTSLHY
jgi:hypothetical protein